MGNVENAEGLKDFVRGANIDSIVEHETNVDKQITRKDARYTILDLPEFEAYSEIDANV